MDYNVCIAVRKSGGYEKTSGQFNGYLQAAQAFFFLLAITVYRPKITSRYASRRIMMSGMVRPVENPRRVSRCETPNRPKATPTYSSTRDLVLMYSQIPMPSMMIQSIKFVRTTGSMIKLSYLRIIMISCDCLEPLRI